VKHNPVYRRGDMTYVPEWLHEEVSRRLKEGA
jgi:hypothetical protein